MIKQKIIIFYWDCVNLKPCTLNFVITQYSFPDIFNPSAYFLFVSLTCIMLNLLCKPSKETYIKQASALVDLSRVEKPCRFSILSSFRCKPGYLEIRASLTAILLCCFTHQPIFSFQQSILIKPIICLPAIYMLLFFFFF